MLDLKTEHKNLEEKAYEIIKDMILAGKLKPNIRLKEVELARQLNVIRTTIKTALVRLKGDYLVENAPKQIAHFTVDADQDLGLGKNSPTKDLKRIQ